MERKSAVGHRKYCVESLIGRRGEQSPFAYLTQDYFIVISGVDKRFFYVLTNL